VDCSDSIVQRIADADDWTIDVTESNADGVRFEFLTVTTAGTHSQVSDRHDGWNVPT